MNKIKINNPQTFRGIKIFMLSFSGLSILSFAFLGLDVPRIWQRAPRLAGVFLKLGALSFQKLDLLGMALLESVSVTLLSIFYSIFPALVLGALMASNVNRNAATRIFLSGFCSVVSAVPTTVWALIVLACLGFGPAPGIIGLCFHTVAFLSRAFQQSFENVPAEGIEALSAAGSNRLQIFFCAIVPSALPSLAAWCAIRVENNFSESTILCMVGAGGVGYTVMACMNNYEYGRAGFAVFAILILSYGFEIVSVKSRMMMQK